MISILLVVIYLAFISLGLPDSLLGSAWPTMYQVLGVPISWAGILSMIIAGGTILSSLRSDRLISRYGTGKVTMFSVAMTAAALFGFSFSSSFWQLCLWAVPYGLGAGSVDAALNNFVALHYESRHMSWLHCFWGIGATAGPAIMGLCLSHGLPWQSGYQSIGLIQTVLTAILFFSLPLWLKMQKSAGTQSSSRNVLTAGQALQLPGAARILLAFFCYCSLEASTGLWASSYLTICRGLNAATAASWASLFYLGITLGRLLSGFFADRIGDSGMIRIGQAAAGIGAVCLILPLGSWMALAGLILIGLGCAPIYPSMLHRTPKVFGAENSQSLMGMQMACAYVGSTFAPPLFGLLSGLVGMRLYPLYLLCFIACMTLLTERSSANARKSD